MEATLLTDVFHHHRPDALLQDDHDHSDAPVLHLPTDYPRQRSHHSQWEVYPFTLPASLISALHAQYQSTVPGPTLPLLAALQLLLAGYTQQDSVLVGLTGFHASPSTPVYSPMGIVLLSTDMSGYLPREPFLHQLHAQIQTATTDPTRHVFLPSLTDSSAPQLAYRLPCQVLFHVQSDEASPGAALAHLLTECDARAGASTCELVLTVGGEHGNSQAALVYDAARFTDATISRMATHWLTLLARLLDQPARPVTHISLLTDAEYHDAVHTWNATRTPYPHDACVHDLFTARVARVPAALAAVFANQRLTYQQLDQRANQLAHLLQAHSVGPETIVGVYLDRSLDLPIAWLGILKAGGAYLPLDPAYPGERLRFMLNDARVSLVVTQSHLSDALHTLAPEISLICLDQEDGPLAHAPTTAPHCSATPDSLAYVIYTSGSTGRPKGVLLAHRGLTNLARAQQHTFAVGSGSRVLQFAALSFDASVWEMAMALLSGATLFLAPKTALLPGEPLVQTLHDNAISIVTLPPSVLASLPLNPLPKLSTLIVAGEACPPELVAAWAPGRRFFNAYGPTETTVCATIDECSPDGKRPPIGRPIANTQVYLLNRQMQPVPIGVAGEVYIGGVGVARGYLHRPDLTAERFVANPFEAGRLYRTGDLAHYLPDGRVDFLGRIDHQVKIRGFRIEPGEIETVLRQHPAVDLCVVIVREDIPGQKRLVAYVVPRHEDLPGSSPLVIPALRQHAQQQLPDYMVPAAFVVLDKLPRTPNDKLDRAALPAPDTTWNHRSRDYVAPRTPREQTLAKIWARVLHLETVGVSDNFFELGGDSILSIQIIAAAHQAGLHLLTRHIFQYPTIAELAAVAETTTVEAEQGVLTGPVPLTPIQRWFFAQEFPDPHHWNQAMLLTVPPDMHPEHLRQTFAHLLHHHDALRLRFTRTAAGWHQAYSGTETEIPFQVIDLAQLPVAEQRTALEAHAAHVQADFDLETTPRLRAVLFHLGTGVPQRLLIVINYLAVDGVTWRILLDDIQTTYQAIEQGQTASLPPKTTSYRQWAHHLVEYARHPDCRQELAYWVDETRTPTAPLPLDYPEGANTEASEQSITHALSREETYTLLHEALHAYHTRINDLLLAALLLAYARWTGKPSLRIDLEGHGREDLFAEVDVSRTTGWFTSFYPVYLHLPEQGSPASTLVAVKEHLRHIPHHGIGYGVLRHLSPEPEICACLDHPRPAIRFNYLGQFDQIVAGSSVFRRAPEAHGPTRSPRGQRTHLLVIEGLVIEGQLQLSWMYSANLHDQATIASFAQHYMDALRELIAHCTATETRHVTPSDFALARLDVPHLARIATTAGGMDTIEDILVLSASQQGILLHSRLSAHEAMYIVQWVGSLRGDFDSAAFQHAWTTLLQRHPILRTSFVWEGLDEPHQVIHHHADLPWTIEDWRHHDRAAQEQQLNNWLIHDQCRGIAPDHAPLMRMALFQVANEAWTYVWTFHHGILEGWSTTILLQELFVCYHAHRQHQLPTLPPARPYREYIAWMRHQNSKAGEPFWRDYLAGFMAPTPLLQASSHDRQDGVARYANLRIPLSNDLTHALHTFGRTHQLTLGTLIQGIWALLLNRYSGEHDVVFGLTVSDRPAALAGIETIVGLCLNTIPVRVSVQPEAAILPWLRDIQVRQSAAREYEHIPLVTIQQWSDIPPGMPLFHTLLSFENYPGHTFAVDTGQSNLQLQAEQVIERTNYPLALAIREGDHLELRFMYDTHVFDAATISRIGRHVQTTLEHLLAHPEQRLGQVPLLSEVERHRLLLDWSTTVADYPRNEGIHRLFEQQAERTPEAVALVFADQQMTYHELNTRANQLAHYLHSLGVPSEGMVGICIERSPEMVIGMLGILKAGGVYVPLDPAYPAERLAFMLKDTRAPVLVVQQETRAILPDHQARLVCIDSDRRHLNQQPAENLDLPTSGDHLAYVMYTSGSTGRPKGVLVPHRGITRLVFGAEYACFGPEQVFLQLAPISFDASTLEIWGTLLHGAPCVLYPDRLPTAEKLGRVIRAHGVNSLWLTASLFNMVLDQSPTVLTPIRQLLVGGEALSVEHIRRALELLPDTQLINGYGPTENTTFTCCYPIPRPLPETVRAIPIGRPIGNTTTYILDPQMQPVPIGVPGELYIGGDGLARGYLNRPAFTAERFVPNPFSDQPPARLYRTGDLVCWLPDGTIDFLGRIDQQVKIRGFRIEPGEIEVVLCQHPAVQQAVVVARDDATGKRLVAYVVGTETEPATLRTYLSEHLPDYMIPSAFVSLDALPLTPSGKINRLALPDPATLHREAQPYTAPHTTSEHTLATIWRELLGVEHVGIHDNFFDLGGTSLHIGQLYDRLQAITEQPFTMIDLFDHPTIADLARLLTRQHPDPLPDSPALRGEATVASGRKRLAQAAQRRRQTERKENDPH